MSRTFSNLIVTYIPSSARQAAAAFAYDDYSVAKGYIKQLDNRDAYSLNCIREKRPHFGQRCTFITEFEIQPTRFTHYQQVGWLEDYGCWEVKLNFSGDDEMRTGGPWIHCGFFEHAVHAAMVHDMHMIRKGFSKVGDQTGAKWPLNFPDRLPTFEEAQVIAGITPAPAVAASASALSSSSSSLSSSSGAISRTGAELTQLLAARQYKGVTWHDRKKQWQARFDVGTSYVHLGFFSASVKASHAHDAFAKAKGNSKERALDAAVQSSADSAENVAGVAVAAPPASKKKRRKRGPSSSSSTYYGVSWNRTQQKWTSQVWNKLTKKQIRIGSFISEADAARAVDAYIVKSGLARELNFPDDHKKKKKKSKRKHPATAATIDAVSPTCRVDADAAGTESKMYRPLPLPTPSPLSKKQRKAEANGTSSRFLGVTREHQRWIAQLRVNGATKYLGSFRDELDAARAVDACIVENSLRKALNFPAADTNTQTAAAASRAQTAEDAAGIALAAPPALTKKKRKRRRGMCGRAGPFVHTSRTVPSFMLTFISLSRFLFSMIHYPSMREYRTTGERRVASHNNSSWERKGEGVILRETVRMRAYVRALRSAAACGVVSPARLSSPWSLVESVEECHREEKVRFVYHLNICSPRHKTKTGHGVRWSSR